MATKLITKFRRNRGPKRYGPVLGGPDAGHDVQGHRQGEPDVSMNI